MNINIANIGDVSIEVNKDISKIAHKAWWLEKLDCYLKKVKMFV